jgi:hypothetical protein
MVKQIIWGAFSNDKFELMGRADLKRLDDCVGKALADRLQDFGEY